jgi:hypothetical protein
MKLSVPTRDQALWLLTAHPDTWELGEAPGWLVKECIEQGLVTPSRTPGVWKKTARADELLQRYLK